MNSTVLTEQAAGSPRTRLLSLGIFTLVLLVATVYVAMQLGHDLHVAPTSPVFEYVLLGIALLIALGFEFVNGFHDTANAVATVIYTRSLPATFAVVWSGGWNFVGVLISSGAVAYAVLQLLPIGLVLNVGSGTGFAMVFALLLASIVWNLGTWYLGLPSSSSHTLIGSIIGVGLMNQMMNPGNANAAVDWSQALSVGKALLFSPLIGFGLAFALLMLLKKFVKAPELYAEPHGDKPPPFWVRSLLILTCTGVSFAHGSNDGQKGMGLIMLILIGTVPSAYALNRAVTQDETQSFVSVAHHASETLQKYAQGAAPVTSARSEIEHYIQSREATPTTMAALVQLTDSIGAQVANRPTLADVPEHEVNNVRNNMYLSSEALRLMEKDKKPAFRAEDSAILGNYHGLLDKSTKFIPPWVKVAVAIALGLGTMVGWRRIVRTVGERIGKQHLTYAQGASAEVVAMLTIGAADRFGLPVSTTHVLSSGVAGSMVANGSGLQWSTVRSMLMAWVLTLPVSIALAAGLFWLLRHVF
ncbi:MAG: inorganic phosphate transporter [Luteibacter sp.]|uniref:inorganic phosphate transporter n=1 Tax=Luteibacter TaxID=242605 RepID=UPI0005695EC0|nr:MULTISPECIES: inorganic phosphate transporter [unclassified Luteibacter]MDQ7997302.1 inorganic phosphate transporter [Luteibacter sp.]MDQ8049355.1 inorganic phosphate transporter [Luteibacter sp.]